MPRLTNPREILALALKSPVLKRYPPGTFKTPAAQVLAGCMDLREASGEVDAEWNPMALAQINTPDSELLSVDNKCRQRGWSFNESALSGAYGILVPRSVTQFVSYNEKESQEKIEYARRCIDALVEDVRPELVNANLSELRFDNGSRIESLPCKEPRGKGKPRIVLDEFAMYGNDDVKIFQAALGACMRGGCVRVGSTPKPSGLFRELATGELAPALLEFLKRTLPGFEIITREWPWWVFDDLCHAPVSAAMNAPAMATEARVEQYGTDRLKTIYATYMITGDVAGFQQECECQWVSETAALINPTLVYDAQKDYDFPAKEVPPLGIIAIGVDYATRQDQTVFEVVHYENGHCRIIDTIRMRGADAETQRDKLRETVRRYKPFKVKEDVTDGFGKAVHGMLEREFAQMDAVDFTKGNKEEMISATIAAFVNHAIDIPRVDKLLADDIMSIRKVQTVTGHVKYDSPRTAKGHADSFWALALALSALPRAGGGAFEYQSVERRPVNWTKAGQMTSGIGRNFDSEKNKAPRRKPSKWSW